MSSKTSPKKRCLMIMLTFLIIMGRHANADFIFGTPENLGPTVNSSSGEGAPSISADGLELYFTSLRDGWADLWITKRESTDDDWGEPVNLGLTVNSSHWDGESGISADGLELYFASDRPGGFGGVDLWVTRRATKDDPWEEPVNLGPNVNTSVDDTDVCISTDGLSLYIESYRSGGHGRNDLWVSTRKTKNHSWGIPMNLGPAVNSSVSDGAPSILSDGRILFFSDYSSPRPGGFGGTDIWVMRRTSISDTWAEPVNLGPTINRSSDDQGPNISADGSILYFFSRRSGGSGEFDLWQASIEPIVDLNSDGIVDVKDVVIITQHWGEDYPLCDIGPTPFGDGIVDVLDLLVLADYIEPIEQDVRALAHWTLDELEGIVAYDSAGNNNAVTSGDPLWQPTSGMIDGTLLFDGIDDYIDTPFILNPANGSLSVSAWINGGASGQVIISQAGNFGGTWLGINNSVGKLMTGFSDVYFGPLESEAVITDGQWHHVGLVYDLDVFHRQLYVDGLLVAEDTTVVAGVPSDGGMYIGAGKDLDATTFFSGLIDDVRIYNKALSTEEIEVLTR
ncbi:MAG: hypothetical protein GY774_32440 [Planctomycetes bacterium]|nr:hypothetical protein [Planctomycetota bacterium]